MANDKNEKTVAELYEFLQENMVTKKEYEKTTTEIYEFLQENMVTKKEYEKTTTEIYEFLQEHMVTREEFQDSRKEMAGKTEGLKDHIDEKLSDLRGDIVILMRKEDYKVLHLVKLLKEKNILSDKEVRELVKMEPFPNTAL